ncbi:GH92 family glycosyl hydrolase [Siphonobacter sp. SORGH_AS_0500]|uniref:GH92 family glycosyl hydrolase n=1 Tax=Siphonobacter sp. SORGH_AS_0500 TaxID=1864824 RepID=UPI00285E203D|nr:GH92 family glycosyl hydrolase [Siphonobacter sp. SORGH_AS_0500]MDR6198041.1 putative alpha-1,2-mannosidase [Siphonobacter sp. SORGH_AS_0500]
MPHTRYSMARLITRVSYLRSFVIAGLLGLLTSCAVKAPKILAYVDANIGTAHSRWFFYTPAALPHGMAKLAPSTNGHYGNKQGWEAIGYDTRHESIEGFVHFHEWQVGGVSFMPTTGELKVKPGELESPDTGYRSRFDRKNQVAEPGYYKVLLEDYRITAELTATTHVGFHRYTFPKHEQSRIILDVGHVQGESGEVRKAEVRMIDDTHFEGLVTTYPKYVRTYDPNGQVSMYFWGEVSKKPTAVGAFTDSGIQRKSQRATGKGAGLFLEYATTEKEAIEVKVGLSYTSIANAKANFTAEASGLSFETARQRARNTWQAELGKIVVEGSETNKVKFYTGLFHALLGRGVANDVNGSFPRHDGTVGQLPRDKNGTFSHNFYNTDAIWGAYWNLTQLWALSYPERYSDFVHTQLEVYKERGWFGDGIVNSNFVSGVGTNFVGLAIAGAYQSGIRDYDTQLAYQAIKANELLGRNRPIGAGKRDVETFVKRGYVPYLGEDQTDSTGSHFSASHTLEYSFSTFAAAQLAKALGKEQDYQQLIKLSNGWRRLYDPKLKLIRPKKADGTFIEAFDPYEPWRGFQEGNAVQYTFFVPQNPKALIETIGKEEFNNRLDSIFTTAQKNAFGGGKEIDAFAGIKSMYNHGNQPNLHSSWLFNFSEKPWLTQKWTRAICDEFYGTQPIHGYGYGQDEDQGQLGSWYVMASLGLFDVKGFTDRRPIIELGSPAFDRATIRLGNGKRLRVVARQNSAEHVYVQSATFNGKPLTNCWLYRDELMQGGTLVFVMGSQPNKNWGTATPPPSVQ